MNVLIIRPGALGDTLMVLPALANLTGKASITFVARQPGLDYIRSFVLGGLDLEGAGWHRLFLDSPDEHCLPVSRADLVVAFFSDEAGNIRQNLNARFPHVPVHIFPSFPSEKKNMHAARYIAECLKSAGLPVDPEKSVENAVRRPLLGDIASPAVRNRIVLHPGSGDPKKNHPPGFWLKLLKGLGQKAAFKELKLFVLLGPAEKHLRSFFEKNLRSPRAEIRFCPEKDHLIEILRQATLYIGHDSGITHLSAMLGTPTIALFRGSNVNQWSPLGPCVRVIQDNSPAYSILIENVFQAAMDLHFLSRQSLSILKQPFILS
ncbi:MAG: glycosyltransferase family 9 protein [Deltaproteobacteria bacterium]|nr:glycosyltransferase family 9 protein [Deltaproteobacteria bacterium]MBW2117351.1 glycosyltransferase family 9 protein [Deltaproteobacteria bacterium]MBW2343788.1 glycosyltransferase family 9 protein [Deltaproteobacteria bacterium]